MVRLGLGLWSWSWSWSWSSFPIKHDSNFDGVSLLVMLVVLMQVPHVYVYQKKKVPHIYGLYKVHSISVAPLIDMKY